MACQCRAVRYSVIEESVQNECFDLLATRSPWGPALMRLVLRRLDPQKVIYVNVRCSL